MRRIGFNTLPVLLSVLFLVVSCKESIDNDGDAVMQESEQPSAAVRVTAHLEQPSTKTSLDPAYDVVWSEGDQIRIFSPSTPSGSVFMIKDGAGSSTATFEGSDIGEGPYYAVYPASAGGSLSGDTITSLTVLSVQVFSPGSFGQGANLAAAVSPDISDLSFRNVFGALSVTLTGSAGIERINLYTKGREQLWGTATLSIPSDGVPGISFAGDNSEDRQKLSLSCGGVQLDGEGTAFFMTVPAGAFSEGFTMEVTDTDGKAMVRNLTGPSSTIVRSVIVGKGTLNYVPAYNADFLLSEIEGGAFTDVSGACLPACRYEPGIGQYAYFNTEQTRYFRIEDWTAGFALGLTTPRRLATGPAKVAVEPLGNAGVTAANAEMNVLKTTSGRAWIHDPGTDNGYIMSLLED